MMIVLADNLWEGDESLQIEFRNCREFFSPAKCHQLERRCQPARTELIHRPMDHNRIEHGQISAGDGKVQAGMNNWLINISSAFFSIKQKIRFLCHPSHVLPVRMFHNINLFSCMRIAHKLCYILMSLFSSKSHVKLDY